LALMAAEGFEMFVTIDQNLVYQQNVRNLPVVIVVLYGKDNRRETLRPLFARIFERLDTEPAKKFIEIF
jgi:hypothetical protein